MNALTFLVENKNLLNGFYHYNDKYTLTTKGYIWTYPGEKINSKCVIVSDGTGTEESIDDPFGICTDYPIELQSFLKK